MPVSTPSTILEAVQLLDQSPHALVLSGGTDVMVEINMARRRAPATVVAVRRIEALRTWWHQPVLDRSDSLPESELGDEGRQAGTVIIGAGLPFATMEHGELADLVPALAQAARTVGSPQIRSAATLGGNLGTSSPAGDGLPVLYALDAVTHLQRHDAPARDVPVTEFVTGVKENVLEPGELITAVTLPIRTGWQGYSKVGVRNAMVIATVSVCLSIDQRSGSVGLALGAVGPTVIRCRDAEGWLAGEIDLTAVRPAITDALAQEFGNRAATEARPIDDHRSTAGYRSHAVGLLSGRLLARAAHAPGSAQ